MDIISKLRTLFLLENDGALCNDPNAYLGKYVQELHTNIYFLTYIYVPICMRKYCDREKVQSVDSDIFTRFTNKCFWNAICVGCAPR
jgi:hypothetical protein